MPQFREGMETIWSLIADYRRMDEEGLIESIANHLEFSECKNRYTTSDLDVYRSFAMTIRDRLVEFWNDTQQSYHAQGSKMVYYLSLEYLIGRSLRSNLVNLGIYDVCKEALNKMGYNIEDIEEMEQDAGLGNGGLGRLAACFMESMATLALPAFGYGIRYEYGIFRQSFKNGAQVEFPDNWLEKGYPWEIPRWDVRYPIRFYGRVEKELDENGRTHHSWVDTELCMAMAYDVPVCGYKNHVVNNLRLWSAKPSKDFDFDSFNRGDYMQALENKQRSETISKVLYPNDQGFSGKELRLKQQYFFVSASIQDMIRRYKSQHDTFDCLPQKVSIQLNDTHPSIAVPELMRVLMDEENLEWDQAWGLTTQVFSYTNHTVLPEALEKWSTDLLGRLLPRHLEIIYEINKLFLIDVAAKYPGDAERLSRMSMVEEGWMKSIRMPNLAIVGSHATNGVAALHTELLKTTIFKDFYEMYPKRFQNKTNGITPRLWLRNANPELSKLIIKKIGDSWITHLEDLRQLESFANDAEFQEEWRAVKQQKKQQLAVYIKENHNIEVNPDSIFDVHIKRMHEYKRQLLNILNVIRMYVRLRENPDMDFVPRTIIFGGKAAPGYDMAKNIIRLINDVARVVNRDPIIKNKIKIVFIENYSVSLAEKIIPATDISQHISTAGMEASGTSNMKFVLNGALILGTEDGANIEIHEEVGDDNIFTFGLDSDEVMKLREGNYNPRIFYQENPDLHEILSMINTGYFNREDPHLYNNLYNALMYSDYYLLFADFAQYKNCQQEVSEAYKDQERWTRMSILNTAYSGKFSSDRTVKQYADEIWDVKPVERLEGKKKVR